MMYIKEKGPRKLNQQYPRCFLMGPIGSKRERTGKAADTHYGSDLVDFGISNLKLEVLKLRPFNISKFTNL